VRDRANEGISIGTTFSLYTDLVGTYPFSHELVQITMGGRQHSYVNGNWPVTADAFDLTFCRSTSYSAIWISGGKSPTSSRKSSRRSPIQNAPGRRCVAPVKAPFS